MRVGLVGWEDGTGACSTPGSWVLIPGRLEPLGRQTRRRRISRCAPGSLTARRPRQVRYYPFHPVRRCGSERGLSRSGRIARMRVRGPRLCRDEHGKAGHHPRHLCGGRCRAADRDRSAFGARRGEPIQGAGLLAGAVLSHPDAATRRGDCRRSTARNPGRRGGARGDNRTAICARHDTETRSAARRCASGGPGDAPYSGLSPQKVRQIHQALGTENLADLESACRDGRVRTAKGLGPGLETKILTGIELLRRSAGLRLIHRGPTSRSS
jgi:hypothetical protein